MKPERLYRCPVCGEIITEEEFNENLQSGSSGYCYCEYSRIDPDTGEVWYPRFLHEYDVYILQSSTPTARKQE